MIGKIVSVFICTVVMMLLMIGGITFVSGPAMEWDPWTWDPVYRLAFLMGTVVAMIFGGIVGPLLVSWWRS